MLDFIKGECKVNEQEYGFNPFHLKMFYKSLYLIGLFCKNAG